MTDTNNKKTKMAFNIVTGLLMTAAVGVAGTGFISVHNTLSVDDARMNAMSKDEVHTHYQKHCVSRETDRQLEWYYDGKETVADPVRILVDPQDPSIAQCAEKAWTSQVEMSGKALIITRLCGLVALFALTGAGSLAYTSYKKKRETAHNDMNGPQ
ncbi:hypothetical protein [Micavibrio aeruginosavorus]|uniref:hypothetical protein n=1 Tax=Micavibrio aeruginosavorus TaxID=349221 RepID=UPI003F4A919B